MHVPHAALAQVLAETRRAEQEQLEKQLEEQRLKAVQVFGQRRGGRANCGGTGAPAFKGMGRGQQTVLCCLACCLPWLVRLQRKQEEDIDRKAELEEKRRQQRELGALKAEACVGGITVGWVGGRAALPLATEWTF